MELVEGQTLATRIAGEPLPARDALRYAVEIAEAMARAHQANVVHRDLKPDNVIVGPDGHVKILDFGLAKLREDPDKPSDQMQTVSAEMTRDGRVLGTASFMSPEQARGLPVDHRSDIFSYGVMLYQMFAGRLPFDGATVTDTLSAILRDDPEPLAEHNPATPPELERISRKCLEKEVDDRYQRADELVVDLRRLRRETDSQPIPRISDTGATPIAGRPAWLRPLRLALAVLGIVAIAITLPLLLRDGWLMSSSARAAGSSLAVLPLQNLKDGEDPERLGRILQELIITDLSGLESLRVFSSQRLFDIRKELGGRGPAADREVATEVAKRAGARTMLTGSLSQLGPQWILTAQLVNVADGAVLKSERIDGSDLYAMVDSLTARIRDDLGVDLATGEGLQLAVKDKTTDSIEAYKHFLEGVERLNAWDYDEAVEELERAVEIDPSFGQAYYKLAIARWWFSGDQSWWVIGDPTAPDEILRNLLGGDFKLSEKDRRLAKAFLPLVMYDYLAARPRFERLVVEYPDDKEAWYGLGEARYHSPRGSLDPEAVDAFERALKLDPSFRLAYSHVSAYYQAKRMYDAAIAKLRELIERNPDDGIWYRELVRFLVRKGDDVAVEETLAESLRQVVEPRRQSELLVSVGWTYQSRRRYDEAERRFRQALDIGVETGRVDALNGLGWSFFNRNDYEQARKYFEQGLELDTTDPALLNGVSSVHARLMENDEQMSWIKSLIDANPEYTPYYGIWIEAAINKGDEAEAEGALQDPARAEEPLEPRRLGVRQGRRRGPCPGAPESGDADLGASGAGNRPDDQPGVQRSPGARLRVSGSLVRKVGRNVRRVEHRRDVGHDGRGPRSETVRLGARAGRPTGPAGSGQLVRAFLPAGRQARARSHGRGGAGPRGRTRRRVDARFRAKAAAGRGGGGFPRSGLPGSGRGARRSLPDARRRGEGRLDAARPRATQCAAGPARRCAARVRASTGS
jgi:tetratricopeptide (TPR) repeat protein/TolB-like protein